MRLLFLAMAALVVLAVPTTTSALDGPRIVPNVDSLPTATAINATIGADCEKASRYACGQYMLEDGTRQDFVSQVYNCIPRDKFICNVFKYAPFNPNHPGEASHMVAAKVDPGCTCFFWTEPCDRTKYAETWSGWQGELGAPEWSRPAYTDKKFKGWWCYELPRG